MWFVESSPLVEMRACWHALCCEVDYCGVIYFVDREIDLGNSVLRGMRIELSAEGLCVCVSVVSQLDLISDKTTR